MAITQSPRLYHDAGYPGLIASPMAITHRVSGLNNSDATIPFGAPVVRDGERGIKAFAADSTEVLGVLVREYTFDTEPADVFGVAPQRTGTVITLGEIYVTAGEAVSAGDPVYVSTDSDTLGAFLKAGTVKLDGAVWRTDAEKGAVAVISLKIGG